MKENKNRSLGRPRISELRQPTHQTILQAASELFLANGYQEVSVDDVANKCDITKATVYYYYDSKAELFTETMVQLMHRIREHLQSLLHKKTSLLDRLYEVAEAHLHATVDIDVEGFMRETKNALSVEQAKRVQQAEENMYESLELAFVDAMENGEIPNINTKFAAHTFIALVRVGHYRAIDNSTIFPSIKEAAEQIVRFFWNGLGSQRYK